MERPQRADHSTGAELHRAIPPAAPHAPHHRKALRGRRRVAHASHHAFRAGKKGYYTATVLRAQYLNASSTTAVVLARYVDTCTAVPS